MSERLELVTEFSSLATGMVCVGKPCELCGGVHRFILLNTEACQGGRCFRAEPTPKCAAHPMHINDLAVNRGRIYRVIDGLEQQHTTSTKAPRKLEKQP